MPIIRFIFGLAVGSFLNVLATRYNPDGFLLSKNSLGGRSHCPHCKHALSWYELVPLVSFAVQGGKCLNCRAKISFLYPIGELLGGLIFVFVPEKIASLSYPAPSFLSAQVFVWLCIFLLLQLLSFIDFRFQIIPDEGSLALVVLGVLASFVYPLNILGMKAFSFIGHYAYLFNFQDSLVANRLFGVAVGAAFFGLLILITRGRGMGFGDLKLSLGLGLIFGWPDVLLVIGFAFIIGALIGGFLLLARRETMKSSLPFVPFLALGAVLVFFYGYKLTDFYFSFLNA
ncbi:MAG: prepilin peptidase [Candidatus Liptonbacteria bacterium]|nr:prepilin peptidase [Candidatus Liptonbacteria bacterium]